MLDDVLAYDPKTSDWKKIGSMMTARRYHAASLVNMADVIDYCNRGHTYSTSVVVLVLVLVAGSELF